MTTLKPMARQMAARAKAEAKISSEAKAIRAARSKLAAEHAAQLATYEAERQEAHRIEAGREAQASFLSKPANDAFAFVRAELERLTAEIEALRAQVATRKVAR